MVFTSLAFVGYFLPFALAIYYLTPANQRNKTLALLSYLFYGWWNPWFCLLLLASTVVDFFCGKTIAKIASSTAKRGALLVSLITNLSLLATFKYLFFFCHNLNLLLKSVGPLQLPEPELLLPIGISFYTFQSMSYTIDLYRNKTTPANSFIDFACYVSLFPQLIAGPIVRYRDLAPQLLKRSVGIHKMEIGISFFIVGFAKKVLIANHVGVIADAAFDSAVLPWYLAWIGVTAYAMQIYFDFSGYSDMAIGLGYLLGFDLPRNFNSPYKSTSLTDFWHRWHISLSTWLRDYLYIPLGGSRKGKVRTYFNLLITMLLGGLWHGAQWQFVVWGGFHGALLAMERSLSQRFSLLTAVPQVMRRAGTFILVLISWVFFRANSLPEALTYLESMFGLAPVPESQFLVAATVLKPLPVLSLATAMAVVWFLPTTDRCLDWFSQSSARRFSLAFGAPLLLLFCLTELTVQAHNPFLYFRF